MSYVQRYRGDALYVRAEWFDKVSQVEILGRRLGWALLRDVLSHYGQLVGPVDLDQLTEGRIR